MLRKSYELFTRKNQVEAPVPKLRRQGKGRGSDEAVRGRTGEGEECAAVVIVPPVYIDRKIARSLEAAGACGGDVVAVHRCCNIRNKVVVSLSSKIIWSFFGNRDPPPYATIHIVDTTMPVGVKTTPNRHWHAPSLMTVVIVT